MNVRLLQTQSVEKTSYCCLRLIMTKFAVPIWHVSEWYYVSQRHATKCACGVVEVSSSYEAHVQSHLSGLGHLFIFFFNHVTNRHILLAQQIINSTRLFKLFVCRLRLLKVTDSVLQFYPYKASHLIYIHKIKRFLTKLKLILFFTMHKYYHSF